MTLTLTDTGSVVLQVRGYPAFLDTPTAAGCHAILGVAVYHCHVASSMPVSSVPLLVWLALTTRSAACY